MSKKGKKKSRSEKTTAIIILATAITNLLIQVVELISKILD